MLFSFFGLVPVRVQWKHCLLLYGQTQSSCVHNGLQHKKSYSPTGSWHLLVMGEKLFFCNSCYARLRHSWASVLCMHSSPHTTALIFARKCDSRPSCTWRVAPSVNATNALRTSWACWYIVKMVAAQKRRRTSEEQTGRAPTPNHPTRENTHETHTGQEWKNP